MPLATTLKSTIKRLVPKGAMLKLRKFRHKSSMEMYKNMENNEAVFDKVYTDLVWKEGTETDSASGDGSFGPWLEESVKYIASAKFLEGKKVLEIGCGDFSFGSKVAGFADHYTGGDVSGVIIEKNKERYANMENVTFMQVDATAGPLPQACLLYTSPSPRDRTRSRMPSSA